MYVVRRAEGQWVEVTHPSGDRLRVRARPIPGATTTDLELVFDAAPDQFDIRRPEADRPRALAPKRA